MGPNPADRSAPESKIFDERLEQIEQRNQRVSYDKAWETSWTRRILIAFITYLVVVAYSAAIGGQAPFLTALVPVAGFLLSTLTIPAVKRRWIARYRMR